MVFPLILAAGMAAIGAMGGAASAKADNKISEGNAKAREKVQEGQNTLQAATGNLERWMQSVNNNRRLDAGGEQLEVARRNASREADDVGRESIVTSLQRAEQQGASAAAQAFSGVGGTAADMINASTSIRDDLVKQALGEKAAYGQYDRARRAGAITSAMIGGMDSSLTFDRIDNSLNPTQKRAVPSVALAAVSGAISAYATSAKASSSPPATPSGSSGVAGGTGLRATFNPSNGAGLRF